MISFLFNNRILQHQNQERHSLDVKFYSKLIQGGASLEGCKIEFKT